MLSSGEEVVRKKKLYMVSALVELTVGQEAAGGVLCAGRMNSQQENKSKVISKGDQPCHMSGLRWDNLDRLGFTG